MNESLLARYHNTRQASVDYCSPLAIEDYGLQAADFASPPKWHLAHTSWFFETFLLKPLLPGYQQQHPIYETLFNSYYNGIGQPYPRAQRGLLSRPTVAEVLTYRKQIDSAMQALLTAPDAEHVDAVIERTQLGIEHECQHQELFFTDLKYSLASNPIYPAYREATRHGERPVGALRWQEFGAGNVDVGHAGNAFCFDNELPRHTVYLHAFALADRLITNAEYEAFIEDGGYRRPELWMADGWSTVQEQQWGAPLYWLDGDSGAREYTLHGLIERIPDAPVCHVSGYEADAFARWSGARLPTEQEWEFAASQAEGPTGGVDSGHLHPKAACKSDGTLQQLYDSCWQWTQSAYTPYPGYKACEGAIGEYNGKFMSNQLVLRGGSCVSKAEHLRSSYRNFFYPPDRWQFSGIRLARDTG
ncbi:MAG: ergothioneine biosynthesis protein EgtB [Pseudomonadota bacterium]